MIPEGTLVHGRYCVSREIGHGGMGAVYEAIDTRLQCKVALKQSLVRGDLPDRAFVHEAQLLAGLRHAMLPLVTDYFIEGDGQFLVMQYIAGEDLASTLRRRNGPFPLHEVLRWCRFLFDALEYLHGHDPAIVHRDIKPGNLKLTDRGEIVLLDFGLAKGMVAESADAETARSVFGYSLRYAPPEQIQGRSTDPRSDLYALGATLYHLLTGNAPPNGLERATAQWNNEPDPLRTPRSVNPAVPEAVSQAIVRAMALDPADRFGSAADMRKAMGAESRAEEGALGGPGEGGAEAGWAETVPVAAETASQARRVDAAVPGRADIGKPIDLFVQVRFHDSPRLGLEDWPVAHLPERIEQASEPLRLSFPVDPRTGTLRAARVVIKLVAPDFIVEGKPERLVEVPPDDYSRRIGFLLTATRPGVCRINVEVYGQDAVYLGAIPVETDVGGEAAMQPALRVANLLLEVLAGKMAQVVKPGMAAIDLQDVLAVLAPGEARAQEREVPRRAEASREPTGRFAPYSPPQAAQRAPIEPRAVERARAAIERGGLDSARSNDARALNGSAPAADALREAAEQRRAAAEARASAPRPAAPAPAAQVPMPPAAAPGGGMRWVQVAASAAAVLLIAGAGLVYFTSGSGTPRQVAALPPTAEQAPGANVLPGTDATMASRPPGAASASPSVPAAAAAAPPAAASEPASGRMADLTVAVQRVEKLSTAVRRVHLSFLNRSTRDVPIAIDEAKTYVMDASRHHFAVLREPLVDGGGFRMVVPAGRTVTHWLDVSATPLAAAGGAIANDALVVPVPRDPGAAPAFTTLVLTFSRPPLP